MGIGMEDMKKMQEFFAQRMKEEQQDRLARYRVLNQNVKKGETLFVGSSLMEQFPINELAMTNGIDRVIYNRGIGGFTTDDMLANMEDKVYALQPSRIFINIGTNDIGAPGYRQEVLMEKYEKIITSIRERLSGVEIYMMAYYPVNETDCLGDKPWAAQMFVTRTNENILLANAAVEKLAAKLGCHYIDVSEGLRDERGKLKKEFTIEGIHMYANGYQVVLENMKKYL